jgi:hypothetical protein
LCTEMEVGLQMEDPLIYEEVVELEPLPIKNGAKPVGLTKLLATGKPSFPFKGSAATQAFTPSRKETNWRSAEMRKAVNNMTANRRVSQGNRGIGQEQ